MEHDGRFQNSEQCDPCLRSLELTRRLDAIIADQANAHEAMLCGTAARNDERMRGVNDRDVVDELHAIVDAPDRRAANALR